MTHLPERSVAALERADFWPHGTVFHREPMPRSQQRAEWAARKRSALRGANLVFLDPDKGLGEESKRHATFNELDRLRKPGRTSVFITFPARKPHDLQVEQLHERLSAEAGATSVVTLRTSVSVPRASGPRFSVPRQRWFTVVDPDATLIARACDFAEALATIPRVRAQLDGPT